MAWLVLIGLIFMGVPIAEAIAARIKKGGVQLEATEVQQALKLAEQRLAASETRIAALEEKLDFYEKLLANPQRTQGPTP